MVGKWTFGIITYTLCRAKSNGTIHFVLSKIGGALAFSVHPYKNGIFSVQLVFFTVDRKFSQTNIFSKCVYVLFITFFSKICNKKLQIKSQRSVYPCRSLHCLFWHPESLTLNSKLMVNLTLVTDQLFLDTFIITSSGQ